MGGVSRAWIDPNGERPIFERIALLRPFLEELKTAHGDLVTIQVTSSSMSEEIKKLTQNFTSDVPRSDLLSTEQIGCQ